MKRLLLQGDTHSNYGAMKLAINEAVENECDAVVQLGDFGFWPRQPFGRAFIKKTSKWAKQKGIPVYWIDGNHEDFDSFDCHGDSITEVRDNLFYIPRGYAWEWNGVNLLAMGGAVSIDRDTRTPGISWFIDEQIGEQDIAKIEGITCDVMFTHDAPLNPLERFKNDPESEIHRQRLKRIVSMVKPETLYHGHYHRPHKTEMMREGGYTTVVGLSLETGANARKVIDLDWWKK